MRKLLHPLTCEHLDEALVLRFDGPASSTGEDVIELHCHGGRAVIDAILSALGSLEGLRPAEPGEFTRRAFENGRIDLTEAEGLADLLEAETEAHRKAALALAEGGLTAEIRHWQERLLALSAQAERLIDYDDDDEPGVPEPLSSGCGELAAELREWLDRPRIEVLKDGVKVVVAGPPNAGKSSLINAIVGSERAIVTEVAGTTRDYLEVPLSLAGMPILLIDTAGLRATGDRIEAIGVARASALVDAADVLLWLGEPTLAPDHRRLVRVHAQVDRAERGSTPVGSFAVSSKTGDGIGTLLAHVSGLVGTLLPSEGAIALNRRQAGLLTEAAAALGDARETDDILILAEDLRLARSAFDRLTGRAGVEDVLDALFGRFCLGK